MTLMRQARLTDSDKLTKVFSVCAQQYDEL